MQYFERLSTASLGNLAYPWTGITGGFCAAMGISRRNRLSQGQRGTLLKDQREQEAVDTDPMSLWLLGLIKCVQGVAKVIKPTKHSLSSETQPSLESAPNHKESKAFPLLQGSASKDNDTDNEAVEVDCSDFQDCEDSPFHGATLDLEEWRITGGEKVKCAAFRILYAGYSALERRRKVDQYIYGTPELRAFATVVSFARPVQKSRNINTFRQSFLKYVNRAPESCRVQSIPGLNAYWVTDDANALPKISGDRSAHRSPPVVMFVHGGGFISGDISAYRGFLCRLCQLFGPGTAVLFVDYRLVPETRIEETLEDVKQAYHFFENLESERRVLLADSAGSLLLLSTLLRQVASTKAGVPNAESTSRLPVPLVLLSPWLDLTTSSPAFDRNQDSDSVLLLSALRWIAEDVVLEGGPVRRCVQPPWITLMHECQNSAALLPPAYFLTSELECCRDDAVQIYSAWRAVGGVAELDLRPAGCHVYPLYNNVLPEGEDALMRILNFVRRSWRESSDAEMQS